MHRTPAGAGKWSPREIIGHLIDSASNNHQRFVRASFQDDLVFSGYDQDQKWVALQQYQEARWEDLLTLWASFNRHLARVMAATPAEIRRREHRSHNFDRIAMRPVAAGSPATLNTSWKTTCCTFTIICGRFSTPRPNVRRVMTSRPKQHVHTPVPLDSRIWQVISASAVGTMIECATSTSSAAWRA